MHAFFATISEPGDTGETLARRAFTALAQRDLRAHLEKWLAGRPHPERARKTRDDRGSAAWASCVEQGGAVLLDILQACCQGDGVCANAVWPCVHVRVL